MDTPKSKSTPSPTPVTPKPKNANAAAKAKVVQNPPYTTKHGMTSPKFGSAGSGGAENDPGPEAD